MVRDRVWEALSESTCQQLHSALIGYCGLPRGKLHEPSTLIRDAVVSPPTAPAEVAFESYPTEELMGAGAKASGNVVSILAAVSLRHPLAHASYGRVGIRGDGGIKYLNESWYRAI